MEKRLTKIIFIISFFLMLVIPFVFSNFSNNGITMDEKRELAPMAKILDENGSFNKDFTKDFEAWINDNIGFRSQMLLANTGINYYLFNVLSKNTNLFLGPEGELNYATDEMIEDYQHFNLYPDSELHHIADCFQYLNDYAESKGAKFYFYQCWDKHSVYPEYFPNTVYQYGEESKTDGIVRALSEYSNVKVISPKEELINSKQKYDTYSKWGDPTHWTPRGAYIGYVSLMEAINADSDTKYKILGEDDYNIEYEDQGDYFGGGFHKEEILESFRIKDLKAIPTNKKLTLYSEDESSMYYSNYMVDNRTRVLIIGDSYFGDYILDDIAESFYETIMIWGTYASDSNAIIDEYSPDIVIFEEAERCDRTPFVRACVRKMKNPYTGITGVVEIDGKKYLMENGRIQKATWITDSDGNRYYSNHSGIVQTGWVRIDGNWYFMTADGVMQTGWVTDGGKRYYMSSDGEMQTGWITDGGKKYYLTSYGVMRTGWVKEGENWYYFEDDGVMVTGIKKIGDVPYIFNRSGVCLNP